MTAPTSDTLPTLLQTALDQAVPSPEVVRWTGRPGPVRDHGGEWLASLFGWVWIVTMIPFTIWLAHLAYYGPVPDPEASPAFTLLVCSVFVGIGVLPARAPARKRKRRANTVYAVTDRRAIIIETWWAGWWAWWRWPLVRSFGPADLGKLRRVDHPDGRGDVVLGERVMDSDGWIELDAFFSIAGAREVEALVRSLHDQPEPAAVQHPHD